MSQGVNVLRYSALVAGAFYGFSHQASITSAAKTAKIDAEYQHKADLITKAKAAFTKKNLPKQSTSSSGKLITDPDDKNFDLEAYLTLVAAGETPGQTA